MANGLEILEINAVCDTPVCFTIQEYCFKPLRLFRKRETFPVGCISLGKYLKMQQIADGLGLNLLNAGFYSKTIPTIDQYKDQISQIIALATLNGKDEVNDQIELERRTNLFSKNFDQASLLDMLNIISRMIDIKEFQDQSGMTEEIKKRKKEKKKPAVYETYGGLTIWGSLISYVLLKYHWTYDYAVWGISYQNLSMLLSDEMGVDYDTKTDTPAADGARNTTVSGKNIQQFGDFGSFIGTMKAMKGEVV